MKKFLRIRQNESWKETEQRLNTMKYGRTTLKHDGSIIWHKFEELNLVDS